MRPGAILPRILVALALILFGVPQSHAAGAVAQAGPAAESQVEKAQGILTVQRYLLRTQVPDDTSPDMLAPGAAVDALQPLLAATMSPAPQSALLPAAMRILPPVRGPPAV